MSKSGSSGKSRRVSNGLVGLSSAAVLTIYGAGYMRTRPAAAKFALAAERRHPTAPVVAVPLAAPPAAIVAPAPLDPPSSSPLPVPSASPAASTTPPPASPVAPQVPVTQQPPRATPPSLQPNAVVKPPSPSAPASTRATSVVAAPEPDAAAPAPVPEVAASAAPAAPVPDPVAPPAPATALAAAAAAGARHWKDGTFLGWGTSRHGDIEASVVIQGGRILSATISQCLTRYSCSWIAPLPPQVVARQSQNVDYVSGATQSTNAFYDAVVDALSKAK